MKGSTPTRTCIACGKKGSKSEFVRVLRTPAGQVMLDEGGKAAGRGAYLCRDVKCFETASKRHMFSNRLKVKVSPEDLENLERGFRALCAEKSARDARDGE